MSFSMTLNLETITPAGQSVQKDLPTGVYTGEFTKCEGRNGGTRAMFILRVTNGEFEDCTCITSMKIPTSLSEGVVYYWRAMAESCGYSPDEIADIDEWNDQHFLGKKCYFDYKEGNKSKNIYSKVTFLTPENYEGALKAHQSSKSSNGQSPKSTTSPSKSPKISVTAPNDDSLDSLNSLVSDIGEMPF